MLGLSFSSQAGNGLAGWGWNVSGLSTISRIPSTKFHDGIIDPVDFDALDRFSINGQRLVLKRGIYGAPDSEYETENYSNVKIVGQGTSPHGSSYGPSYFIVYYPDGSRAWYGNSADSNGLLEWSLTRKEDAQGNYIAYAYEKNDNLLKIKSISYGANGSSEAPNRIQFVYKNRNRAEVSYINGQVFKRSKILDHIEIYGGSQMYRKYRISHEALDHNSLGYQKINAVTEFNGSNVSFSPVQFTYETTASSILNKFTTPHTIYPAFNYNSDILFGGEFDGDGKTDLITYSKYSRNKLNIFTNLFEGAVSTAHYEITTSDRFETVFSSNTLSQDNRGLGKQSITTVSHLEEENPNNYPSEFPFPTEHTTRFRTIMIDGDTLVFEYDKIWNSPAYGTQVCNYEGSNPIVKYELKKIPMKYVSGDFNGDGLTDVLALGKPYTFQSSDISSYYCNYSSYTNNYKGTYFIDLKRDATSVR